MKTALIIVILFAGTLFAGTAVAADSVEARTVAAGQTSPVAPQVLEPPARPLPLTDAQLAALDRLSQSPDHAAVNDLHAELSKRQRKVLAEAGAHAFYIAFAGAIVTTLIFAAPL